MGWRGAGGVYWELWISMKGDCAEVRFEKEEEEDLQDSWEGRGRDSDAREGRGADGGSGEMVEEGQGHNA